MREAISKAEFRKRQKERFVALLSRHVRGGKYLSKNDYDGIELLAKRIGQKKYRRSLFRGIVLAGRFEKKILDIMANEPVKLSTLKGSGVVRHAESWTPDPSVAHDFAEFDGPLVPYVILEARPAPKDIVITIDKSILPEIADAFGTGRNPIKSFVGDREVVVRTGDRKYTLCRNIRFINIPKHLLTAKVRIRILQRIKDEKNLGLFESHVENGPKSHFDRYQFACGNGNVVYLESDRSARAWIEKLSSR